MHQQIQIKIAALCHSHSSYKYTVINVVKCVPSVFVCLRLYLIKLGAFDYTGTNTQLFVIIMDRRFSGFIRDSQC